MRKSKKTNLRLMPTILVLLVIFLIGSVTEAKDKEAVDRISLNSEHINISDCIENAISDRSEIKISGDNNLKITCEGVAARDLYYQIGYGMVSFSKDPINGVSLTKSSLHVTPNGKVKCHMRRGGVANGIVHRIFSCELGLTAAKEFLAVGGTYKNAIVNGDFSDHSLFLNLEFKEKGAIYKLVENEGEIAVEKAPVSCVPTQWDQNRMILRYQCQAVSKMPGEVLVYAPQIMSPKL